MNADDDFKLKDTSELQILSEYAGEKKKKMTDLLNVYTDIGFFGRVWDSKVPENKKALYYFSSITESDTNAILNKINLYQKFYEEINAFVHEVTDGKPVNSTNFRRKFAHLKKELTDVYQTAKREKLETSSSAIYMLHKSFITEYEKLDYILKDCENVALCEMLTEAQNGWKKALDETDVLKKQLGEINKQYSDMCNRFDYLTLQQQNFSEKQNDLLAQNTALERKLNDALETMNQQNQE